MKKYFNITILIIWMLIIFLLSNSNSLQSSSQSRFIVNFINKILNIHNAQQLEFIIRKIAHLFEYVILEILTINCLKDYNLKKYFLLSLILCLVYACVDEIHQMFIPGRNGNICDVLIDFIGSTIGAIFYYLIYTKNSNKNIVKKI